MSLLTKVLGAVWAWVVGVFVCGLFGYGYGYIAYQYDLNGDAVKKGSKFYSNLSYLWHPIRWWRWMKIKRMFAKADKARCPCCGTTKGCGCASPGWPYYGSGDE